MHLRLADDAAVETVGQRRERSRCRRQRLPAFRVNPSLDRLAGAVDRRDQRAQLDFVLAQVAVVLEQRAHAVCDVADLAPDHAARGLGQMATGEAFVDIPQPLGDTAGDPPAGERRDDEPQQAGAADGLHQDERGERGAGHGHGRDHARRGERGDEGAEQARHPQPRPQSMAALRFGRGLRPGSSRHDGSQVNVRTANMDVRLRREHRARHVPPVPADASRAATHAITRPAVAGAGISCSSPTGARCAIAVSVPQCRAFSHAGPDAAE